ncbi:hypothetical protein L596_027393 [Steinernema carpocapsae]|uniref:Uncharacterized protein n=1 Tax=Steinernema carpocapsae TaxID=34508 RepID=A0A4U5M478_STECR|nr:hypothetical protein L596_027393 [Steinernema carpocapsae]
MPPTNEERVRGRRRRALRNSTPRFRAKIGANDKNDAIGLSSVRFRCRRRTLWRQSGRGEEAHPPEEQGSREGKEAKKI